MNKWKKANYLAYKNMKYVATCLGSLHEDITYMGKFDNVLLVKVSLPPFQI